MLKQEFSCAFQDVCRIDSLTRRWLKDFQQSIYKNFYSPRFCQKCRLKKCLKVLSFCVSNLLVRSNWYLTRLGWKGNGSWARGRRKGEAAEKQKGRPHHPRHHCPHHHRPHQIHLLQSRSILAGRGHRQQSNQAGERQVRTKWKMRTGRMNKKGVFFCFLCFFNVNVFQSGRGDWGGDQSWVPGIKCGRGGLGEKGILNVGWILYQFCIKCERAGTEKGEFWSLSEFSQPGCKTSSPRKTQRQGAGKVGTLMLWHSENIIWNVIYDWVFDTTG